MFKLIRDKKVFMNTSVEFTAWTKLSRSHTYKVFDKGFDHFSAVIRKFSRFDNDSDLMKFNNSNQLCKFLLQHETKSRTPMRGKFLQRGCNILNIIISDSYILWHGYCLGVHININLKPLTWLVGYIYPMRVVWCQ